MLMTYHDAWTFSWTRQIVLLISLACLIYADNGVPGAPHISALRAEAEELFYHGFDNYMLHAFPEDELRPVSCQPLSRDRGGKERVEVNDVLGNYSLTLVDSLSTLAILASSESGSFPNKALKLFQDGVKDLVMLYGDGSSGDEGQGTRARGFDLDSKVQVFETVIRGLGGLLSAHLFAVGDLPISGYSPDHEQVVYARTWRGTETSDNTRGIQWQNGFIYDGQLLRLAYDLANRLLPAFWTSTGIPYPRVNLKYGTPFYANSPGNKVNGQCDAERKDGAEATENCAAGAGSLVLEMTVLSRLTGDEKFEELAKRAFWAIWDRRSSIDLVGGGIDAETGTWSHSWTGIGAGVDSFFEYAFKSHVLLSNKPPTLVNRTVEASDPRSLFEALPDHYHTSAAFLDAWDTSHMAIKRHILKSANFQHPHYVQVDLTTGASRAVWVDALAAYYPGLLALSGHIEEAIEAHLMFTALWTRFSALPERYNMASGTIEGGLGWWLGRPELIESTWYLYRATGDPFYIYVAEMFLRDMKRRSWTKCGLTGLQNVVTGEQNDRMESFFLGETAKYMYLLFAPKHPLNELDAPFVFTTEGHPLIIPSYTEKASLQKSTILPSDNRTCPTAPKHLPFTVSNVAARGDVYHAASLAKLHLMPKRGQAETFLTDYAYDHPSITLADVQSPSNWTYYPWTLPLNMVPHDAMSSTMPFAHTFELSFPKLETQNTASTPLQRVKDGILINSLSGLRLSMVQDVSLHINDDYSMAYRVNAINGVALGKDEKIYLPSGIGLKAVNPRDPLFARTRDLSMLDLVVDARRQNTPPKTPEQPATNVSSNAGLETLLADLDLGDSTAKSAWNSILTQLSDFMRDAQGIMLPLNLGEINDSESGLQRLMIPAIAPTGVGAAPFPDWSEASGMTGTQGNSEPLTWSNVFPAGTLCDEQLPASVLRTYQIILIKRGGCSFSKKLSNIPIIRPNKHVFQLAIIVDHETDHNIVVNGQTVSTPVQVDFITRPLLDELQTTSSGLLRQNLIPMVMVGGGENTYDMLSQADGIGIKRRYSVSTQGIPIANLFIV